jgi:hypothetical protein
LRLELSRNVTINTLFIRIRSLIFKWQVCIFQRFCWLESLNLSASKILDFLWSYSLLLFLVLITSALLLLSQNKLSLSYFNKTWDWIKWRLYFGYMSNSISRF